MVTPVVPLIGARLAVRVAEPWVTEVTNPEALTVATEVADDDQAAVEVKSFVEASL